MRPARDPGTSRDPWGLDGRGAGKRCGGQHRAPRNPAARGGRAAGAFNIRVRGEPEFQHGIGDRRRQ